jgi:hypothetical protein
VDIRARLKVAEWQRKGSLLSLLIFISPAGVVRMLNPNQVDNRLIFLDSPGSKSGRAVRRSVSMQLATVCNLAACVGVSGGASTSKFSFGGVR